MKANAKNDGMSEEVCQIRNHSPEHFYEDIIEWYSQLNFCADELNFLHKLLDRSRYLNSKPGNIKEIRITLQRLNRIQQSALPMLKKRLLSHQFACENFRDDKLSSATKTMQKAHYNIKLKVFVFMNEIRILKKTIFEIVEKNLILSKKIASAYLEGSLVL